MAELRDDAKTEVDFTSLESAVTCLEELEQFVKEKLIQEPAGKLNLSNQVGKKHKQDEAAVSDGARIFGGFPGALEAAAAYSQLCTAVQTGYQGLEKDLGQTAEGTTRIVANYRTAEEQNQASVADIARLLSGDAPAPGGGPALTGRNTEPVTSAGSDAKANPATDRTGEGDWNV